MPSRYPVVERLSMLALDASQFWTFLIGVALGVTGFAPMLLVVMLSRMGRIKPSVGKGMAAVAVSFFFLMAAFGAIWLFAPQDILVIAVGFLGGFLVMWAVLAAKTMSH